MVFTVAPEWSVTRMVDEPLPEVMKTYELVTCMCEKELRLDNVTLLSACAAVAKPVSPTLKTARIPPAVTNRHSQPCRI
jgi:hypothetical protein